MQERLGHSTITLTLDTYSHLVPDIQKEAVKALDNLGIQEIWTYSFILHYNINI